MSLQVSWEQYNTLVERLALIVYESGFRFNQIICIARGGMPAAERMEREGFHLPEVWRGLANFDREGMVAFHAGYDAQTLLDDNWSFAVVIDFVDMATYERWFRHPEHKRIGGPIEPFIAETSRVVYEVVEHA